MGLFNFLKKQFVDVIEWNEEEDGVLSSRYPFQDNEIQNGAVLTVRESQMALFVNEGRVADQFGPGRYILNTQTLPLLTNIMNWDKAFASPFKSDVYFMSTRLQQNRKWGTPTPITVRDPEFGPVRIRAYGTYAYRVNEPRIFFRNIAGTRERYTVNEIDGQLGSNVVTNISSFLASSKTPFLDMAANLTLFSSTLANALKPGFVEYGLELHSFFVQSVSLPEELQRYLDKSTSMRMVGDLNKYTQFQTAEAIGDAANNPNGGAGAGMSMGAGLAMGQAMAQNMGYGQQQQQYTPQTPPTPPPAPAAALSSDEVFARLDKLGKLLGSGVLTQAEFDAKKAELLKQL
ncbi:MAG: SPFH domain-containing protein [Candidatus Methylacidiphilales bacterium]|nr:SPFH domain-containing protein [Candidatus Methylacidiphilales bacterium]